MQNKEVWYSFSICSFVFFWPFQFEQREPEDEEQASTSQSTVPCQPGSSDHEVPMVTEDVPLSRKEELASKEEESVSTCLHQY